MRETRETAQQEQDLDKTTNDQPQEPNLKGESTMSTATAVEVTTTGGAATAMYAATIGAPLPLPIRALFDVEVDGLLGFSLIPKCDLAKDLAGAWMGGTLKASLVGRSRGISPTQAQHRREGMMDVTRLECRIEPGVLLSAGGDPFYTGRQISEEERGVALAAIEAHREAKANKRRPKRRAVR